MNKTEIQSRIDKCEAEIASLKAEFAKCDCTDGIEQEKCWFGVTIIGDCLTTIRLTKEECQEYWAALDSVTYFAYMPECRQVTGVDAINASSAYLKTSNSEEMARKLHKLGFRMKVTP